MDPGLLKAAEVGANLGQDAVVTAIHQRQQVGTIMNQFMAKYDLLLTPTMPMTAFAVNENAAWGGDGVDIGWTPFTLTFNLTRQPAATIPCGLDREGLPIGLQIVGGHARDALVLRAAAAYERVRPIPAPPMAHQIYLLKLTTKNGPRITINQTVDGEVQLWPTRKAETYSWESSDSEPDGPFPPKMRRPSLAAASSRFPHALCQRQDTGMGPSPLRTVARGTKNRAVLDDTA